MLPTSHRISSAPADLSLKEKQSLINEVVAKENFRNTLHEATQIKGKSDAHQNVEDSRKRNSVDFKEPSFDHLQNFKQQRSTLTPSLKKEVERESTRSTSSDKSNANSLQHVTQKERASDPQTEFASSHSKSMVRPRNPSKPITKSVKNEGRSTAAENASSSLASDRNKALVGPQVSNSTASASSHSKSDASKKPDNETSETEKSDINATAAAGINADNLQKPNSSSDANGTDNAGDETSLSPEIIGPEVDKESSPASADSLPGIFPNLLSGNSALETEQQSLFPEENAALQRQSGSAEVQTALWDVEENQKAVDWKLEDLTSESAEVKNPGNKPQLENAGSFINAPVVKNLDPRFFQSNTQTASNFINTGRDGVSSVLPIPTLHPEALRLMGLNPHDNQESSQLLTIDESLSSNPSPNKLESLSGSAVSLGNNAQAGLNPNESQGQHGSQGNSQPSPDGQNSAANLEVLSARNSQIENLKSSDSKAFDATSANLQGSTETVSVRLQQLDEMMRREATGRMASLQRTGNEQIQMQLIPAHLGKVHVALELRDGSVNAHIHVESESARVAVDASLTQLRDALTQHGLKIENLTVTLQDKHADLFNPDGSNADGFFNQKGRNGSHSGQGQGNGIESEALPEVESIRHLGYNTLELLA